MIWMPKSASMRITRWTHVPRNSHGPGRYFIRRSTMKTYTFSTPDVADLITIVWNCAARAYEEDHTVPIGFYDIREVDRIKQSWAGSTKETVFTLAKSWDDDLTEPDAEFPVLVVAIRGSSAFADFMVDLNQRPTRATDFLSSEFEVHAGFLAAARSLHHELSSRIEKLCDEHDIDRVVFTGHSAGAAVASLLFLHFRMHGTSKRLIERRLATMRLI